MRKYEVLETLRGLQNFYMKQASIEVEKMRDSSLYNTSVKNHDKLIAQSFAIKEAIKIIQEKRD